MSDGAEIDVEKVTIESLFEKLHSSRDGLSTGEARHRLDIYGANEIEEQRVGALRKLLGYFWGPIAWMIEAAAILSALVHHWADLIIIIVLLVFNAVVGFWQEF